MKITTKQITIGGAILAIMIFSQFVKSSVPGGVFITGSIVNLCLIIATLSLGLGMGAILSVIAPVTSYIISGAPPAFAAIPLLMPSIMLGNILLCIVVSLTQGQFKNSKILPAGMVVGAIVKAAFMNAVIVNYLIATFANGLEEGQVVPWIAKMSYNMSFATQAITAVIGSVLATIIWMTAGKYLRNQANQ